MVFGYVCLNEIEGTHHPHRQFTTLRIQIFSADNFYR